jgi:hypothetical protein
MLNPCDFLISNHEGRKEHKEKQETALTFLRELRGWNKIDIFQEK